MKFPISRQYAWVVVGILTFFTLPVARADYCAVGQIKGNVCWGFVIESCKFISVDAVKGDDGRLFTLHNCYDKITDYQQGRCWVDTKSRGGGLWSWTLNAAAQPEFLHKNEDGKYEDIDVEYLTFKCVRR